MDGPITRGLHSDVMDWGSCGAMEMSVAAELKRGVGGEESRREVWCVEEVREVVVFRRLSNHHRTQLTSAGSSARLSQHQRGRNGLGQSD